MPFTILDQGSFTSTGVGVQVPLPSSANYFKTVNLTQMSTTQNPGRVVQAEWYGPDLIADNDGIRYVKTNSNNAINMSFFSDTTASDGFTYVTTFPKPEAAVTGSAITAANPAVVTMTNTFSEGDRVRLYDTTGMLQIAGIDFTISTVTGSNFELLGLDASGFAAAATNVVARRIPKVYQVEPSYLYVTNISQALEAVVTVSIAHSYVVGQLIRFSVPDAYGMTEINGLTGKITAVGTYTITVDINSSAFTAFAFPTSAEFQTADKRSFATVAPAGQRTQENKVTGVQTGYDFDYPPFHNGLFLPYMFLAAGAQSPAGSSGDVVVYQAYKSE